MADPTRADEAAFAELLDRFAADALDADGIARLEELLRADPARRRVFVDACLQRHLLPDALLPAHEPVGGRGPRGGRAWAAGVAAALLVGAAALLLPRGPGPAARVRSTEDCLWVTPAAAPADGAPLAAGARLELAAGSADLVFESGAEVTVRGPAVFEVESGNSGVLTHGRVSARAAAPSARGFTVRSRAATVVDLGTEFEVSASPDGHSQVAVTAGAVRVDLPGSRAQRVDEGETLEVEPGARGVTAKVEGGEGTAAFLFPTIEPPSAADYADASRGRAVVRVAGGALERASGPVGLLLDGRGQSTPDSPGESVFFTRGETGLVLLDLGGAVRVRKVNTYSWHRDAAAPANRVRATQRYVLYGAAGDRPPPTGGDLAAAGWVPIARVNSDESLGVSSPRLRPPQQAISVTAARGPLGEFRYLLWDVRPTRSANPRFEDHAFYGEFDVYAD